MGEREGEREREREREREGEEKEKRERELTVKRGPMSTSNPRSVNPVAMTLYPLSCPSSPTFATRIRGRLPSFSSKS